VIVEEAGLVLIPETGRDTADGIGPAGCAEVKEDGVVAGTEVESVSEVGGNGVSNGAGLRLTSHGGRDGAILPIESEVTGGVIKDGSVMGVSVEGVTAFSPDLRATRGPAIAGGPGPILNAFRLELAPTTTRWST
jgi:hypothetical protein